ncbi:hypothetical protein O181_071299 [Austropuccinia psidii MF-1]|uniref:Uncharacterized protein n=1 Tax=Austropuccinia psidii MF-1 TaxID=1389203 RepID=A0A9Q3F2I1_9BASI|nr:hypothetical protein [Austropuccinia psidii MF-1]
MKSDEVEHEDFQQPPMKKLKNSQGFENLKKEFMNKEIIEHNKNQEEEILPIEKQLMNSIMEYGMDPENPWRIDKDKEMDLDKENSLHYYYDGMSYWQLPAPEEESDQLILPYIELKDIYYEAPIKEKRKKWLGNIPG